MSEQAMSGWGVADLGDEVLATIRDRASKLSSLMRQVDAPREGPASVRGVPMTRILWPAVTLGAFLAGIAIAAWVCAFSQREEPARADSPAVPPQAYVRLEWSPCFGWHAPLVPATGGNAPDAAHEAGVP